MGRPLTAAAILLLIAPTMSRAQKPECSLRPARGASHADLVSMARVTSRDAEARAIAAVAPHKVNSIISSGVEVVNGCLAFPFDLRFADKGGVQEVVVDAGDGKILSSEYEPPAGGAAQEAPPSPPRETQETPPTSLPPGVVPVADPVAAAEEALIRKTVDAEEDAWNRGDAKAFAARFEEQGTFTDVLGAISHGRAGIESRLSGLLAASFKGSLLALKLRKVRFVRPDVAIAEIDSEVTGSRRLPPAIHVEADKVLRTRLQQVLVKTVTGWSVAASHDVDVKTPPETLVAPEEGRRR